MLYLPSQSLYMYIINWPTTSLRLIPYIYFAKQFTRMPVMIYYQPGLNVPCYDHNCVLQLSLSLSQSLSPLSLSLSLSLSFSLSPLTLSPFYLPFSWLQLRLWHTGCWQLSCRYYNIDMYAYHPLTVKMTVIKTWSHNCRYIHKK